MGTYPRDTEKVQKFALKRLLLLPSLLFDLFLRVKKTYAAVQGSLRLATRVSSPSTHKSSATRLLSAISLALGYCDLPYSSFDLGSLRGKLSITSV